MPCRRHSYNRTYWTFSSTVIWMMSITQVCNRCRHLSLLGFGWGEKLKQRPSPRAVFERLKYERRVNEFDTGVSKRWCSYYATRAGKPIKPWTRATGQENDIAFSVSSRGDRVWVLFFFLFFIRDEKKNTHQKTCTVTPTDDQWHDRTIAYVYIYRYYKPRLHTDDLLVSQTLVLYLWITLSGSGSLALLPPPPHTHTSNSASSAGLPVTPRAFGCGEWH